MSESDRGVRANLLDRKFGYAGRGTDLTEAARVKQAQAEKRLRAQHARAFDAVMGRRPLLPPGRTK